MRLEVTDEGIQVSEQLWHKPRKDEKEMAYLAAVDAIDEYPITSVNELANHLPFVHGLEAKIRTIRGWVSEGFIKEV